MAMQSPPPYTEGSNPKSFQGGGGYDQPAPFFPPQHQQHQPQQQVVVIQPQAVPTFIYQPHPVSMTGALILSCFVFWCFGAVFGGIAFILALIGSDASQNGDISGAMRLRNASYGVSVSGIVVFVVLLIVVVSYYATYRPHYNP